MIKELQYTGYATEPSDYESPDGQLAMSLNLISEDNQLKPVFQPKHIMQLEQEEDKVIFLHKTDAYTHYIIASDDVLRPIYAIDKETQQKIEIGLFTIQNATALGNVLILLGETQANYFLFKDGAYKHLGTKLPEINLAFALKAHPRLYSKHVNDGELIDVDLEKPMFTDEQLNTISDTIDDEDQKAVTDRVMAAVSKFLKQETIDNERFAYPFFVRYAVTLYDGTTTLHSAPILMTPCTLGRPLVFVKEYKAGDNKFKARFDSMIVAADLQYRLLTDGDYANLNDWRDIVKSIDIYVSKPIYGYKQDGKIERLQDTRKFIIPDYETNNYLNNVFVGTLSSDEEAPIRTAGITINGASDKAISDLCEKYYAEWKFQDIYMMYFVNPVSSKSDVVIEIPPITLEMPALPDSMSIEKEIESTHTFYKIASLELSDKTTEWTTLKIEEGTLQALAVREELNDEYLTHERRTFTDAFVYNSRLNLFGQKRQIFDGFTAQSMFAYVNTHANVQFEQKLENSDYKRYTNFTFTEPQEYKIITEIREDCGTRVVEAEYSGTMPLAQFCSDEGSDGIHSRQSWPSYFYYPNPKAIMIYIYNNEQFVYAIALKPHDFLNGAYARLDFNSIRTDIRKYDIPIVVPLLNKEIIIDAKNKIYTSEVNNPFLLPAQYVNAVGTGEVIGCSSATKALSEGQFGQFPLYVFTTEGVWALEVAANGTYSARQPVSRDVCIGRNSIRAVDDAVLFTTNRGIMMLHGSQTQCITDGIFSEAPFNVLDLPGIDQLHTKLGHTDDTCIPVKPFLKFIDGCQMIYDYLHQRIVIFNQNYTYAYIYSLKSRQWGTMYSNMKSTFNAYPEALAMTHQGEVISLSDTDEDTCQALYITRPLKLDAQNILKTISNIIQRGHFHKNDVATVLYASNDLTNWKLVWSSSNSHLRGMRGTAYKFFRIAAIANLHEGNSIFGASIDFITRFNNKLR